MFTSVLTSSVTARTRTHISKNRKITRARNISLCSLKSNIILRTFFELGLDSRTKRVAKTNELLTSTVATVHLRRDDEFIFVRSRSLTSNFAVYLRHCDDQGATIRPCLSTLTRLTLVLSRRPVRIVSRARKSGVDSVIGLARSTYTHTSAYVVGDVTVILRHADTPKPRVSATADD